MNIKNDTSPALNTQQQDQLKATRGTDLTWAISLFGTAVGAGILFLPIRAGAHGLWPLLIVTLLIGPMTYLSHLGLSYFVCGSSQAGHDITQVAREYFGPKLGQAINWLYFLSIYPIILIYSVSITNVFESLLINQLGFSSISRPLLSFILIFLMMAVMFKGRKFMLMVTSAFVYPLIFLLLGISLYLIPYWHFMGFGDIPPLKELLPHIWIVIPVLIFAFSHTAAISQFSVSIQKVYGADADKAAQRILRITNSMLVFFTMFFVWSCVLALGPEGLAEAREQNLPILSYLANVSEAPIISTLGPLISVAAIASSFFGHYLGAQEGAESLIYSINKNCYKDWGVPKVRMIAASLLFVTSWIAAILNPSVLSLIETLAGPVIAAILYLMPAYAIHTFPSLRKYKRPSIYFVFVMGLIAISALIFSMVSGA